MPKSTDSVRSNPSSAESKDARSVKKESEILKRLNESTSSTSSNENFAKATKSVKKKTKKSEKLLNLEEENDCIVLSSDSEVFEEKIDHSNKDKEIVCSSKEKNKSDDSVILIENQVLNDIDQTESILKNANSSRIKSYLKSPTVNSKLLEIEINSRDKELKENKNLVDENQSLEKEKNKLLNEIKKLSNDNSQKEKNIQIGNEKINNLKENLESKEKSIEDMSKKFIFQKEQYLELIRNLKNQIEELKSFEELHEKEKLEKKMMTLKTKAKKYR